MDEREKMPTLIDRLYTEWDNRHAGIKAGEQLVEPTADEARNGWTARSLTKYLADQKTAQSLRIDKDSLRSRLARLPDWQNNRYRPHKWRA